jgi:hypothetical protein
VAARGPAARGRLRPDRDGACRRGGVAATRRRALALSLPRADAPADGGPRSAAAGGGEAASCRGRRARRARRVGGGVRRRARHDRARPRRPVGRRTHGRRRAARLGRRRAGVDAGDVTSNRIYASVGFRPEGTWEEHRFVAS